MAQTFTQYVLKEARNVVDILQTSVKQEFFAQVPAPAQRFRKSITGGTLTVRVLPSLSSASAQGQPQGLISRYMIEHLYLGDLGFYVEIRNPSLDYYENFMEFRGVLNAVIYSNA